MFIASLCSLPALPTRVPRLPFRNLPRTGNPAAGKVQEVQALFAFNKVRVFCRKLLLGPQQRSLVSQSWLLPVARDAISLVLAPPDFKMLVAMQCRRARCRRSLPSCQGSCSSAGGACSGHSPSQSSFPSRNHSGELARRFLPWTWPASQAALGLVSPLHVSIMAGFPPRHRLIRISALLPQPASPPPLLLLHPTPTHIY